MSSKSWLRIALAILVVGLFLTNACGRKKSEEQVAEKITEKLLKKATGDDVDVKVKGDKIEFEGKDFKTEIEETTVWPQDMFPEVPKFTLGKIERVHKSREEGGMQKFNIFFIDLEDDAVNTYAEVLRNKGWEAQVMQAGGQGGMLNAQKGNLAMNFAYSLEEMRGTLMVYTTP